MNKPPKLAKAKHTTSSLPSDAANQARDGFSQKISFSFHFLQLDHDKFTMKGKGFAYFQTLMDRLRLVCGMEKKELFANRSKTLRHHPIEWDATTEHCFGIQNEETIVEEPIQISLSANEHGRIHGFFIGNVFYIIWLDPDHKLYSRK